MLVLIFGNILLFMPVGQNVVPANGSSKFKTGHLLEVNTLLPCQQYHKSDQMALLYEGYKQAQRTPGPFLAVEAPGQY